MRIYAVRGPFGVRSGFARRSGSVRGPFGLRGGPRGVRLGSVPDPFEGRAGFVRGEGL